MLCITREDTGSVTAPNPVLNLLSADELTSTMSLSFKVGFAHMKHYYLD